MPDKLSQNSKDSARPIIMREERLSRLKFLADSINDSARMARGTVSLLLLVALYLGLTVVVSSDENLVVNGQVAIPQTGVGISIVQSYIFAPPIFLYLHIQTLFLLSVLARKVRTFEATLAGDFLNGKSQDEHNNEEAESEEYWDWLSSFAFVQQFRRNYVSLMPTVLTWLVTIVIPFLLLVAIQLSFVRYQSWEITVSHDFILLLDLLFIGLFWRRTLNSDLKEEEPSLAIKMVGMVWVFGILIVIIVIINAVPLHCEPGNELHCQEQFWQKTTSSTPVSSKKENLLDAWLCQRWNLVCRYLDVNGKRLVKTRPEDLNYVEKLDLSERNLRFAKFDSARLPNVDLSEAQLQGADLSGAQLQGADLSKAQLRGANLSWAQLQNASLFGSLLQEALLYRAHLHGASLSRAKLQGASLSSAKLQGANLSWAQLQGATLLQAQLQGASLFDAHLQGAELLGAWLQGANLSYAQLQGADLLHAQLQGADLTFAQLQGSSGKPHIPKHGPILMYQTSLEWNNKYSHQEYLENLLSVLPTDIRLVWKTDTSLKQHLQTRILSNQNSPNRNDWTYDIAPNYTDYSENWAKWTTDFACGNEYAARSSLNRWNSYFLSLDGQKKRRMKFGNNNFPIYPITSVFQALVDSQKNSEDCPGLQAILDDKWEEFYTQRVYLPNFTL